MGAIEADERAAAAPILRASRERRPHGIWLDVAQHDQWMPVLLVWKAFESSRIQMAVPDRGVRLLPALTNARSWITSCLEGVVYSFSGAINLS